MSHLSASTFVDMPIINKDYIEIRPIEFAQAKEVIGEFHKHNIAPQGHKFSMGIFRKKLNDHVAGGDYEQLHDWVIIDTFDNDDDTLEQYYDYEYGMDMEYSDKYDAYALNLGGEFVYARPKEDDVLLGVATIGNPVAPKLMDGKTLEITRICFVDENNNPYFDSELPKFNKDHTYPIPSMFVSAIVKEAKKRGYEKIITFTRVDEFAKYLKATGFNIVFTQTRIKKWKSKNADKMYSKSKPSLKNRWELKVA